jgi:uncharacterized membrane protein
MRKKIEKLWYRLNSSFWFLPALLACAAIFLSYVTTAVDKVLIYHADAQLWWLYSGGPDGARTVLSVIAGSMITVAGVVFSITIVVLSMASSQFGPRLIRNFMNVRANQLVLGTFVATFTYGVLVLRNVDATAEARFVPHLSVNFAIVMSLSSLGVLIYFIHNVSESIQAQNIIARVCRDLGNVINRVFPEKFGQDEDRSDGPKKRDYDIPTTCDREVCQVMAEHSGYLQTIDDDALMRIAVDENLLIHLEFRPGNFITRAGVLATVWPGERVDEKLSQQINNTLILGKERTLEQDVEFGISQLVEIATRALSPGVNDPITAMTCIDWLGAALTQLSHHKMPSSHHFDKQNRLRIICKPFTFDGIVNAAFNMIRQNSQSNAAVSIHLLEIIATVAAQVHRGEDREALFRQAKMVMDGCRQRLPEGDDQKDLDDRFQAVVDVMNREPVGSKSTHNPTGIDLGGS